MSAMLDSPFPTDAELAQFQADAESGMRDTCTITRPNPSDFNGSPLTIYSGKCRVRMVGRTAAEQAELGGMTSDNHRCRVDVPAATTGVQSRDKVTITASISPSLVDFDTYVADVPTVSAASALRLVCERTLR